MRSLDKCIRRKSIADSKIRGRHTIPSHSSPPFFSTAEIAGGGRRFWPLENADWEVTA